MNGNIFRNIDISNPKEMQAIAAIDMGILVEIEADAILTEAKGNLL